jgi:hypothetical protein
MRNQPQKKTLRMVLGLALASTGVVACGGGTQSNSSALPADVKAILFLQRSPRDSEGNVFDYTSYASGGRLVKLEPPSADGTLTPIVDVETFKAAFPGDGVDGIDIQSYDLSFDAKAVVFAASLGGGKYQIFSSNLDGTDFKQLTGDDSDHVYPIYLAGQKILYMTNATADGAASVEASDTPQFRDEYERATTAQVATMNLDGSNVQFGARNVSHRVAPALLPDGHVAYTEWRHMGPVNDGHLRQMNADMTGMREAFGGEDGGNGGTNSYLKARYVQTTDYVLKDTSETVKNYQMITVATSRDRTLQSGKLFLVDLNGSEKNSKFTDLTPLIPGDRGASQVGRYYDAEPVDHNGSGQFIASWSDGPVDSETLALAHTNAQFGLYTFTVDMDKLRKGNELSRFPIFDDPNMWDVLARPLRTREEPPLTTSPVSGTSAIVGALNVYNSSVLTIQPGSIVKVRLLEGFSGEEGGVNMFGSTEFDGQSRYGEIDLQKDNSFSAKVPGNVPFHIQLIDKFAMSQANESIWISGRSGEQRSCGGCHESRSATSSIAPGLTQAALASAVDLDKPRAERISKTDFSYAMVRGVPWDKAIQPILDAKCISCHDANNSAGVPSYTVTDMTTGTSQTFNFDLTKDHLDITVGEKMTGAFTKSYISIMGLGEILGEDTVMITGTVPDLVEPGSAKDSEFIQRLNPMQRFPSVDTNTRAFDGSAMATKHAASHAGITLTPDEMYLFILNIDMGGQFYFRENLDEAGKY